MKKIAILSFILCLFVSLPVFSHPVQATGNTLYAGVSHYGRHGHRHFPPPPPPPRIYPYSSYSHYGGIYIGRGWDGRPYFYNPAPGYGFIHMNNGFGYNGRVNGGISIRF